MAALMTTGAAGERDSDGDANRAVVSRASEAKQEARWRASWAPRGLRRRRIARRARLELFFQAPPGTPRHTPRADGSHPARLPSHAYAASRTRTHATRR